MKNMQKSKLKKYLYRFLYRQLENPKRNNKSKRVISAKTHLMARSYLGIYKVIYEPHESSVVILKDSKAWRINKYKSQLQKFFF